MTAVPPFPALFEPLGRCIGHLPQLPVSAAVAVALNLGIGGRLDRAMLAAIRGRVLRIVVRDSGLRVSLCCDGRRFEPRSSREPADVTISANVLDFVALGLRQEDPDTLFFARRLIIEGDTELGLLVKNALDALDFSGFNRVVQRLFPQRWPLEPSDARGHVGR